MVEASIEEAISLNQYVVNVLSYFSGYATGWRQGHDRELWHTIVTSARTEARRQPNLTIIHSSDLKQESEGWSKTG